MSWKMEKLSTKNAQAFVQLLRHLFTEKSYNLHFSYVHIDWNFFLAT